MACRYLNLLWNLYGDDDPMIETLLRFLKKTPPVFKTIARPGNFRVHFRGQNLWWYQDGTGEGMLSRIEDCDENGMPTWDRTFTGEYKSAFAQTYRDGRICRPGSSDYLPLSEIHEGWL